MMKVTFEKAMTQEDKGILENAAAMTTLQGAARHIQNLAPWLWVYLGGSHIAIHRENFETCKGPRLAVIR